MKTIAGRVLGLGARTNGLKDLLSGYVDEMKSQPTRTVPVQATLGGRKRTGDRVEFEMEGGRFVSEAFAFEAGGESYLLAFTETVIKGEAAPLPATAAARKLVADTLTLAKGTDAEAALHEFQVTVGGVSMDLLEGESRDLPVAGAPVKARMLVLPTRSLRTPEVSFRFPRDHKVDLEARPDGTSRWTVEGDHELVMLVRTASSGAAAAQVQGVLDEIGETMGAPRRSASAETRFGGEKRTGHRSEFSKIILRVATELYPFGAGDAGYVLVFNQTWSALQKPGPPAARRVVEETLTIEK